MEKPKGKMLILEIILSFVLVLDKGEEYIVSWRRILFMLFLSILVGAGYFFVNNLIEPSDYCRPLVGSIVCLLVILIIGIIIDYMAVKYKKKIKNLFEDKFDEAKIDKYIRISKIEKDTMSLIGMTMSFLYTLIVLIITVFLSADKIKSLNEVAFNADLTACLILSFIEIIVVIIAPNLKFYSSLIVELEAIKGEHSKKAEEQRRKEFLKKIYDQRNEVIKSVEYLSKSSEKSAELIQKNLDQIIAREKKLDEKEIIKAKHVNKIR